MRNYGACSWGEGTCRLVRDKVIGTTTRCRPGALRDTPAACGGQVSERRHLTRGRGSRRERGAGRTVRSREPSEQFEDTHARDVRSAKFGDANPGG